MLEFTKTEILGTADRLFEIATLNKIKLYRSPNRIIVCQKTNKESNIKILHSIGTKVKQNESIIMVDELEFVLPFDVKIIEYNEKNEKLQYFCILLELERQRKWRKKKKHQCF